jgi:hypothetical protein
MPATAAKPDSATTGQVPATRYQRTFSGRADQVRMVRTAVAAHLGDCPAAADVVLAASEFATNAILHSRSRGGVLHDPCGAVQRLRTAGMP